MIKQEGENKNIGRSYHCNEPEFNLNELKRSAKESFIGLDFSKHYLKIEICLLVR